LVPVSAVHRALVRCAVLFPVAVRERMSMAKRSRSRHLIPGPLHVPYGLTKNDLRPLRLRNKKQKTDDPKAARLDNFEIVCERYFMSLRRLR
jgi:hypothetical protein